jgi:AbiV family abortive infection protein
MVKKQLPTPGQAAIGARLATANARNHLNCADLLARERQYGTAAALATLSFEETVKARALGAIVVSSRFGQRSGFSDGQLRELLYTSHKLRAAVGFVQHLAVSHADLHGKYMLGVALDDAERKTLLSLAELVYTANGMKQAGLYTDFDPGSGTWSAPADVAAADFETLRNVVSEFVVETERQVDESL